MKVGPWCVPLLSPHQSRLVWRLVCPTPLTSRLVCPTPLTTHQGPTFISSPFPSPRHKKGIHTRVLIIYIPSWRGVVRRRGKGRARARGEKERGKGRGSMKAGDKKSFKSILGKLVLETRDKNTQRSQYTTTLNQTDTLD
jgi:hypothetical protein